MKIVAAATNRSVAVPVPDPDTDPGIFDGIFANRSAALSEVCALTSVFLLVICVRVTL